METKKEAFKKFVIEQLKDFDYWRESSPEGYAETITDRAVKLFAIPDVSGSLHYDEKLLIELWYKRNPCHELNANSGEDMFWKTAFMVFEDYVREVSHNDR